MIGQPEHGTAERRIPRRGEGSLTLHEAFESPCATCATSPCCTHLPLTTFQVTTLLELDHAAYLLNFDHIELGLSSSGEWSAYYAAPCRFLDRHTFGCTVHATELQPRICVHYNPYGCWYKRSFNGTDSSEFVRLDRSRFALIAEHIAFDDDRTIVAVPAWDEILAMIEDHVDHEPAPPPVEPSLTDPAIDRWAAAIRADGGGAESLDQPPPLRSFDTVGEPCDGCAAPCCSTLVFPQSVPAHISNLDYYRFCLGFPGVELLVKHGAWALAVKTSCRHVTDGRCGVFGQPERPLICRYYDAMKCDYRVEFGDAPSAHSMRVRLEQFAGLVATMEFDDGGNLVAMPPLPVLMASVLEAWQPVAITAAPSHS